MSEIDALAFHRGISHSIFFAVIAPFLLAMAVRWLYNSRTHRQRWYKILVTLTNLLLLTLLSFAVNRVSGSWLAGTIMVAITSYVGWRLLNDYILRDSTPLDVPYRKWYWLFFLALITHVALDTFTTYGTQLFQPFSDYRVAFSSISMVDPVYTVPFLIMVILAASLHRNDRARLVVNWLGIGMSCLYLLATVLNKQRVDHVFTGALEYRGIVADRCRTSPTILNNVLWNCAAEDPDAYYVGLYSL